MTNWFKDLAPLPSNVAINLSLHGKHCSCSYEQSLNEYHLILKLLLHHHHSTPRSAHGNWFSLPSNILGISSTIVSHPNLHSAHADPRLLSQNWNLSTSCCCNLITCWLVKEQRSRIHVKCTAEQRQNFGWVAPNERARANLSTSEARQAKTSKPSAAAALARQ